ncbi:MAG: DNA translocase FtsK [Bryobacterales bacterium]
MMFSPTANPRLNEPIGFLLLLLAIATTLSLVSHQTLDPSFNVATAADEVSNLIGVPGAIFSDLTLQWLGLAAFFLPAYLTALGWVWLRSSDQPWPLTRVLGGALFLLVGATALGMQSDWAFWRGTVKAGGVLGLIFADNLVRLLNPTGAAMLLFAGAVVALYLMTSFRMAALVAFIEARKSSEKSLRDRLLAWFGRGRLRPKTKERKKSEAVERAPVERAALRIGDEAVAVSPPEEADEALEEGEEASAGFPPIVPYDEEEDAPASREQRQAEAFEEEVVEKAAPIVDKRGEAPPWDDQESFEPEEEEDEAIDYRVPTTSLLHPPHSRSAYDPEELQALARKIQLKFEEFKVGGSVTQINPGPIVTTFEFKPEAGVKVSKILNLSEDLCMALECESILVERIPGKSTVGIEVPNSRREVISLREVIESREFREARSPLTVAMGKDISGRMKIADLTQMPHLLVAGSTGSGKSVMINAFIMSILLRATPDEVRFIMVDPKTVELGLYHEIPHLLTPVITDMKKANNALKNATTEMERRLKQLAEFAVRNIDQYNLKIERMRERMEREGNPELAAELKRMPYLVIIIDELADLMMLEGRQVEESITRLAQMARAVGIHLVLATQRPSVDVITGLIKANVPARISFRLATRVDSRTILDTMGAEALLGRGDMLFLPPGTARMMRLHGPFVTEEEIEAVVKRWKEQGKPRYDYEYLQAPADETEASEEDPPGFDDPMYQDAVKVVLEAGKASTSTLQRRLRLGYGRAASILDAMEKDGIIGPPNGPRPREVIKPPDWLAEVET